jgi:hypothetical protein
MYDYSHGGASMLNLAILSDESKELVTMADQGKYLSQISN